MGYNLFMKLKNKLLLGYILITTVIGSFSTAILTYNIDKSIDNLSIYREREITSFVKVVDAFIVDEKSLENTTKIQDMFNDVTEKLPHIKRLTLHAQDKKDLTYSHIASSIYSIIGTPSHKEDIEAIKQNRTTILYETINERDYIDITYPITNLQGNAIAALGVAVSLSESDSVLNKAMVTMKKNAINTIVLAIALSIIIAFTVSFLLARKIISPIEKLKNALHSISYQKEYHKIEIDSNDEIGELATAFNTMSQDLNTLHTNMEEKIIEKTKELKQQFIVDALTGLPNREALFEDIKTLDAFGLCILDISSFKDINDVYGIELGNKVLIELSRKYKSHIFESNLKLYRISGDEFVLLNPKHLSKADFIDTIEHIIINIEHEQFYFEEENIEINISIHAGISCEKDFALEKANIALIKAKKEQSNYSIYKDDALLNEVQEKNIKTIARIKDSIKNYGFKAYYQPIVDKNGSIIKYEALVRMEEKDEVISPYFFLEFAKKSKYYQYITKTMVFQALERFESSDKMVSVNICADDLLNEETISFIINQLESFKEPQRVIFELVESEDLHEISGLEEFISTIKKMGCKVAIDDFGTGYSNFSYLLDLEPDYLKIDGSLIKNIDKDKKSYNIVDTIVTFAHNLNITVIAEFIHSDEVLKVCKDLKVDEFQGYLFGEPSKNIDL